MPVCHQCHHCSTAAYEFFLNKKNPKFCVQKPRQIIVETASDAEIPRLRENRSFINCVAGVVLTTEIVSPLETQSTVSVVRNIEELQDLMRDLPDYADQFLNIICKILQDYKETCQASYKRESLF